LDEKIKRPEKEKFFGENIKEVWELIKKYFLGPKR
jgi:hypothetical protein